MKKLMMFAAVMAAGCVPNNTIFAPEDAPEMEPDDDPDPDPSPEPCEPGFIGCDGDIAQTCGSDGTTVTNEACDVGCNAAAERCNECAPDTAACAGNELETCGTDGLVSSTTSCTMGCVPGESPHCEHIVPAFLPNVCDVPASEPTFVVPSGQANVLDTANAANCNGGIIAQAGGPEVCVVRYGTISIDGPLEVIGNRAIAFVADGPLDVDNIIDVSARGRDSGPGGGFRTTGTAPTLAGGGGAGGKQAGANGGNGGEFDSGGPGGATFDPVAAQSFQGGAKAGSALQMIGNNRPRGGGGGGALMLISCTSKLSVTGTIEAGGGGGGAGVDGFSSSAISLFGGAGGGAGGYVVLQGATVNVSGQLFANGGGGGGGCSTANCVGVNGEDAAQIRARGGAGIGLGGAGGGGGFSSTTPAPGSAGTSPGGGGGSTGRFQIFTPTGVLPSTTGAVAQPAFEPLRQLSTR